MSSVEKSSAYQRLCIGLDNEQIELLDQVEAGARRDAVAAYKRTCQTDEKIDAAVAAYYRVTAGPNLDPTRPLNRSAIRAAVLAVLEDSP